MGTRMDGKTANGARRLPPRQRLMLGLLAALGRPVPDDRFQHLLFLCCQESVAPRSYEFVPGRLGAYSFVSHADLLRLTERGMLADGESAWRLTPAGARAAAGLVDADLARFADRHRSLPDAALAAETYRRFPYHAVRSEVAGEVLRGDRAALRRIHAARPRRDPGALLTIGYERRGLDCYLNLLVGAGVTLLCDVRRNAVSRKYGFARSTLGGACAALGIRYEHVPELGISSRERRGLRSPGDYRNLLDAYERRDLPRQSGPLAAIDGWMRSGESVALTCYERDRQSCHRGRVADEMERRGQVTAPVRHL